MKSRRHKYLNFAEVMSCDRLVFVLDLWFYVSFPTEELVFPGNMESVAPITSLGGGGGGGGGAGGGGVGGSGAGPGAANWVGKRIYIKF